MIFLCLLILVKVDKLTDLVNNVLLLSPEQEPMQTSHTASQIYLKLDPAVGGKVGSLVSGHIQAVASLRLVIVNRYGSLFCYQFPVY